MIIKPTPLLLFLLLCSLGTIAFPQEPGTTEKPPLLTFADLQEGDHDEAPFRIEGFVIQVYNCPPCPRGAMCKPCIDDHIVVTDNLDEKDPALIKRLRIFTAKPDQFELKKKYVFTVKVRGKVQKGRSIDQVDLLRFDEVDNSHP